MEELLSYYTKQIDYCIKQSKWCFEKYNETKDREWKDSGIEWVLSAENWEEMAREELVFIV